MPSVASRKHSRPAAWKAMSDESTSCDLPSYRRALKPTKGKGYAAPLAASVTRPFSTDEMYSRGTEPPFTSSRNSISWLPTSGSNSTRATANWP